jgi:hypothetical protein
MFFLVDFLTLKRTIKEKEEKISDLKKKSKDKLLNYNNSLRKTPSTNVMEYTEEFTQLFQLSQTKKLEKRRKGKEKMYELAEEETPKTKKTF